MTIRILQGDCLEVMRTLADNSVDSVVTDPPYGIRFMGKAWDGEDIERMAAERAAHPSRMPGSGPNGGHHNAALSAGKYDLAPAAMTAFQEFSRAWAAEAFRVLKPGGHLLAFASTRTYHRMASGVEDAGFEIRDQLCWHYASGFPKSLNLDNKRGRLICGCEDGQAAPAASGAVDPLRDVRGIDSPAAESCGAAQGELLRAFLPREDERAGAGQAQRQHEGSQAGTGLRPGKSGMEGRRDAQAAEGQLQGRAVRASAGVGKADGAEGRLHHGAPAGDGAALRLPADAHGGGRPSGPQPGEQRAEQLAAVPDERGPQARGSWPVCGRCGKPILPRGLGTALKPATEPIVLARKPLVGTVAANVLQHGTGALNIDGCRVEPTGESREREGEASQDRRYTERGGTDFAATPGVRGGDPLGRWPANLIHDGSDEVLAAFPQVGDSKSGGVAGWQTGGYVGGKYEPIARTGYEDSGSAARFFYTAKASAHDRNDGTYDMPRVTTDDGRDKSIDNPYLRGETKRGNHHPTVKPTDLMSYLCRLVTPPGGTVLDPFAGSGSTLKAAELAGFAAIGIELDPAYIEIARRRIASDAPLFAQVVTA